MQHKISRINAGLAAVREKWPRASALQIFVAFDMANCCIDDLVEQLDSPGFRSQVNTELRWRQKTGCSSAPAMGQESDESSDHDEDYLDAHHLPASPPDPVVPLPKKKRWSKNTPADPATIPPCPASVDHDEWVRWSDIHRKSYLLMKEDPNAYLYRNLPLGVERRIGPWTDDEKQRFMDKLHEVRGDRTTVDGKWGLFSMAVPGRVGYQCSNFYRQLIAAGEIEDSSYTWGADGKLHHVNHIRRSERGYRKEMKKAPKKPGEKTLSRYEQWAAQNPIPDATDPLTGEPMKVPTMSPDGYVFDYTSWMRSMKSDCINPFTRDLVKKRDLVVLTVDNYDQFKDKIKLVNV
jgi:hypothetical protein